MSEIQPVGEGIKLAPQPERVAPIPRRSNTKLAVWIFLSGEVIFFGGLISSLIMFRAHHVQDFIEAKSHLSIPLIGINTFVLILSSYFVVRALEAIQDGSIKGLRLNLLLVTLLGAVFIGGQAFEWTTLYSQGIWFDSIFGTPFFTITGIHGTHVFIGVLWSLLLQWGIHKKGYSQKQHSAIEIFGLYWHFVDVVWIILFTLFYLI
jgi:heme/copper-type cytochrome/quinol oxidase subunit 3